MNAALATGGRVNIGRRHRLFFSCCHCFLWSEHGGNGIIRPCSANPFQSCRVRDWVFRQYAGFNLLYRFRIGSIMMPIGILRSFDPFAADQLVRICSVFEKRAMTGVNLLAHQVCPCISGNAASGYGHPIRQDIGTLTVPPKSFNLVVNIAAIPAHGARVPRPKSWYCIHLADETDLMPTSVTYIEVDDPGQRIDNYLRRRLKAVPKTRIYRMLRRGEARVNGRRVKPTYRVQVGDRVRVPPVRTGPHATPAVPDRPLINLLHERVLFEDAGLLILDKPAGLAVHGGSGVACGLIEALRTARPGRFLELAHRLDRQTSGCLVVATSRGALHRLHVLQRERRVRKSYDLLVAGRWPRALGAVDLPLHRYATTDGERRVRVAAHGKPSLTTFHRERVGPSATWLRAVPRTGRTHQIRVHAAASGHPILGDDKYRTATSTACSRSVGIGRLCLHATRLQFDWEGMPLRIRAPLPPLFKELWGRLSANHADVSRTLKHTSL